MQSSSRNGATVIWLAVHTTEGIMRATDLRAWTSWPGSSHASNDETGVLLSGAEDGFVDYSRASWTLRNGNSRSDNLEQCGWARWTREEWLSRPKLLDTTARWLADRHKARPWIPLVHLSLDEIRAGKPGVIGHGDYTLATGDGSHTDPGKNYPWDVVLTKARLYAGGIDEPEDDMFDDKDRWALNNTMNAVAAMRLMVWKLANESATVDIDEAALAAELAPLLVNQARALSDADLQAVATAVADEQARRQTD